MPISDLSYPPANYNVHSASAMMRKMFLWYISVILRPNRNRLCQTAARDLNASSGGLASVTERESYDFEGGLPLIPEPVHCEYT